MAHKVRPQGVVTVYAHPIDKPVWQAGLELDTAPEPEPGARICLTATAWGANPEEAIRTLQRALVLHAHRVAKVEFSKPVRVDWRGYPVEEEP